MMLLLHSPAIWLLCHYILYQLILAQNQDDCRLDRSGPPVTIVTVDEESPDGTVLVNSLYIKGIASGPSPTISLTLLLNENMWVRLDPALQRLYLNTAGRIFDRDPPISIQSLTVIVQCQNLNVGSTIYHEVKILVRDINDNPPIFRQRSYNMSINELAPVGTTVFTGFSTFGAVDIDDGANGQIEYSILYNPRDLRSNQTFDIPLTLTGAVILRERLNYEDFQKYYVIVQASDRCPNVAERKSSTTTLSIEVLDGDDLGPMFLPCIPVSVSRDCRPIKYYAAIPELARPALVNPINVTPPIEAIDQDRNIQPPSARPGILYSILIGDPGNYSDYFNLNSKTAELQLLQPVNRDVFPQFDLVLKAEQDNGHPLPAYASLHIEILNENNQAPYFEQTTYQGYILESAPVGTTISSSPQLDSPLSIMALDADVQETKDPQLQVLLQGTGVVFGVTSSGITRFLVLLQSLDREIYQQYSLTMSASDGVLQSGPVNVSILVLDANDNTPVFTNLSYLANAYSNMKQGDPVIQLVASDADSGLNGMVHYQILAGDQGQFVINNVTGLLSVVRPSSLLVGRTFTLTVQASDGAAPADRRSSIATVYIEVLPPNNESPPSMPFSFYSIEVSEAMRTGAFLLSVQSVDRENDPIMYNIESGNQDGAFQLNSSTGILSLWKSLDREMRDQYLLILTASDGHPNGTSTATVSVLVTDVNDNDPIFNPLMPTNFSVDEGRIGVLVGEVRATDEDAGINGEVVYSLDNYATVFVMMANGSIYTKVALDREKQDTYTLVVVASDRALDPRHTSLVLTVSVLDMNDNPPIFSQSVYNITVPENGPPGQLVLQLEASDADLDEICTYQLLTTGMSKLFSVDEVTGQLAVLQPLDYETTPGHKYTLLVKAIDASNSDFTSIATVYVNVKDMNDFSPNFTMPQYTGLVAPDAHRGTYIMSVLAVDPDPLNGGVGVIQYEVNEALSGESADLFMVEENTGRVLTKVNLNEEPKTVFKLVLLALDGGDPVMNSSTTVTITVLQPSVIPHFTQDEYRSEPISEFAAIGTSVIVVTASAINQTISYSIISGNTGDTFIVDSNTGVIRTNKPLDYESFPLYNLEVQAYSLPIGLSSSSSAFRSNSATVVVYVMDENDNPPIFNQTLYLGGVTEETKTFTSVLHVKAEDRDIGNNSWLAYKLLLPSSSTESFIIEPPTGIIKTAILFYNMRGMYFKFQVMAVDNYGAGLSGTSEVVISVVNQLDMQVIVSAIPPAVVENNKDQLTKIIERYIQDQIPGAKLVIDSIGPRQYGDGYLQDDYTKSDMAVYAIDPMTNRAISSKELYKILDGKLLDINKKFQELIGAGSRVEEIRTPALVQSVQKQAQAVGYTEGALIALSVIIIICCIPAILIVIVTYKQFKERQAECAKNARIQSALPAGKAAHSPMAQHYDEAGDNTGLFQMPQDDFLEMFGQCAASQAYKYSHDRERVHHGLQRSHSRATALCDQTPYVTTPLFNHSYVTLLQQRRPLGLQERAGSQQIRGICLTQDDATQVGQNWTFPLSHRQELLVLPRIGAASPMQWLLQLPVIDRGSTEEVFASCREESPSLKSSQTIPHLPIHGSCEVSPPPNRKPTPPPVQKLYKLPPPPSPPPPPPLPTLLPSPHMSSVPSYSHHIPPPLPSSINPVLHNLNPNHLSITPIEACLCSSDALSSPTLTLSTNERPRGALKGILKTIPNLEEIERSVANIYSQIDKCHLLSKSPQRAVTPTYYKQRNGRAEMRPYAAVDTCDRIQGSNGIAIKGNIGYGQQGELSMESGIDPGQDYYPHDYFGYEATGYGMAGFGSRRRLIAAPQRLFNEYGEPIVEDEGDLYYGGEGGGLGEDGELMHEGHTQEKAVGQKKKGRHKKQVSPVAAETQPETGHSGSERPGSRQGPQPDMGEVKTGDLSPSLAIARDDEGLPASQVSARRGRILPSNNISPENHDVENQPIFSKMEPDDFSDKQPILHTQMHWKKAKLFPMFFRKIKGQISKPEDLQQIANDHSSKASSSSELVLINGNYFQKSQNGLKPKTFGLGGVLKKVSKGTGKYLKHSSSVSDTSVKSMSDMNEGSVKQSLSSQGSVSSVRSRDQMSVEMSSNLSEQGSQSRASRVSNASLRSRSQTVSRTASVVSEQGSKSNDTAATDDDESDDVSVFSKISDRSALSSRQNKSASGSVSSRATSTKSKVSFGDSNITEYSQRSSLAELQERDEVSADSMSDSEADEASQSKFSLEHGQKEGQRGEDSDSETEYNENESQQSGRLCSVDYMSDVSTVAESKRSVMKSIQLNRSFSRGFSTDTDAILDDHESSQQSHGNENEIASRKDGFNHSSLSERDEKSKSQSSVETEWESENSELEHPDAMGSIHTPVSGSEDNISTVGLSICRSFAETSSSISACTSGAAMSVTEPDGAVESSSHRQVGKNDFEYPSSFSSISDSINRNLPMPSSVYSEEDDQMSSTPSVTKTQSLHTSNGGIDDQSSARTDDESSHQAKTGCAPCSATDMEETEGSNEDESFTGETGNQVGGSLPESDSTVTML